MSRFIEGLDRRQTVLLTPSLDPRLCENPLRHHARFHFVARGGADTAATTLSHLWYFLLSNPACLERLRKEVDDAFPSGEDSSLDLTKQGLMPYLNACMSVTSCAVNVVSC